MQFDNPFYFLEGVNGQISFYEHFLVITRKGRLGFLTQGFDGAKIVFYKHLSAVQIKECGLVTNGYFQVVIPGSQESKRGMWEATQDENTVFFSGKDKNETIKRIAEWIIEKIISY
jgi:hypothetical protein